MSSKLQLDVHHLNRWWRHLMNAYEVRQAWCLLQVKLCDPCLSALKWFVYHARRYTSARLYSNLANLRTRNNKLGSKFALTTAWCLSVAYHNKQCTPRPVSCKHATASKCSQHQTMSHTVNNIWRQFAITPRHLQGEHVRMVQWGTPRGSAVVLTDACSNCIITGRGCRPIAMASYSQQVTLT